MRTSDHQDITPVITCACKGRLFGDSVNDALEAFGRHLPNCEVWRSEDGEESAHTGISATWCPLCGTCTCPDREDGNGRTLDHPGCPLHSHDRTHP